MRAFYIFLLFSISLISCNTTQSGQISDNEDAPVKNQIDTTDMTNNFYDNTATYSLELKELLIDGEIANPGKVDFSDLPVRSVIVKETLLDSAGSDRFVGAYRYDGYSLFDILNNRILKKANSSEFNPIIDLYVEIENDRGDKIVLSWGEIYYPNNLHKIILATGVSRIVPSKTKDLWPLPVESKIVVAGDLVTERNISDPVRITVKSIRKSFSVSKGMSPMYSPGFKVFGQEEQIAILAPAGPENITFNTIFYGRGRGIHSTSPFSGLLLKDILTNYYPATRINIRSGIFCFAGIDGYRCAVSFSELFNRNDQQEFLLVRTESGEDGGLYRVFPAGDFFSDRAVKSLSEIHMIR